MIGFTSDRERWLADRLERASEEEVNYAEIGSTRDADLPPGYNHDRLILHVGEGDVAWRRAREAIRVWAAHARAGITITPANAPVTAGTTVLASRNFGPLVIVAPCRVVYETDEPTRFGFAYGALPGHPVTGEEAFHVVLEGGRVSAEIVAFSRPDDIPTRITSPIARQIQKAATRRYLAGIRSYVEGLG